MSTELSLNACLVLHLLFFFFFLINFFKNVLFHLTVLVKKERGKR